MRLPRVLRAGLVAVTGGSAFFGSAGAALAANLNVISGLRNGSLSMPEYETTLDHIHGSSYGADIAQKFPVSGETYDSTFIHGQRISSLPVAAGQVIAELSSDDELSSGAFSLSPDTATGGVVSLFASKLRKARRSSSADGYSTDLRFAPPATRQDPRLGLANPIPEPSSVLLAMLGGALVLESLRRSRSN